MIEMTPDYNGDTSMHGLTLCVFVCVCVCVFVFVCVCVITLHR